ncbi:hypothetical protein EZV62_014816 [Acer yangbiense]|uniref:Retrotransposon Copia-like N-terminal domain-containing protein n=1 Tax=Acer yangbiense TaxID=1000413 RepID=A0A5C7HT11_9ROSI|nr:hypothetical protein EZV62_014816 [Acer yangbiense]
MSENSSTSNLPTSAKNQPPLNPPSSDHHPVKITNIKLNGDNFLRWSLSVQMYIRGRGKIGYLTGDEVEPAATDAQHAVWDAENSMEEEISANYLGYMLSYVYYVLVNAYSPLMYFQNNFQFLVVDGELYMWGKNSNGQLGLGKKAANVIPVPTKVECLSGIFIKLAALGSEHSVAVTGLELKRHSILYANGGRVLSWGEGGSGRLGHGQESSILGFLRSTSEYTPRLIKKLEGVKVKTAAAGLLHSACIDENGCVFIFGERAVDKMVFQDRNNATTPSLVSKVPYSEDVSCGGYHTCIVTSGGELYSWGSNDNGCLGIGLIYFLVVFSVDSSTYVFNSPEKVQGPFSESTVYKVSCGWKHTAAISEGNVFTWGWGGSHGTFSDDGHSSGGQLGHGNDVDYIQPNMVNFGKNVKALEVSCGFNHTGAILEYV